MGINKHIADNKAYYYIWIDSNIKNKENSDYSRELESKYPNIAFFENIKDALIYFRKIKFSLTFIIVSGSLFPEFICTLKNVENKILTGPKILIFTSETTKTKIEKMDEINDSFYNIGGLVISFEEVLYFLNKNFFGKELNIIRPLKREKTQTGGEFTFQIIRNKNDLAGQLYFRDFLGTPDEEDIIKFDKYLIDNYGDEMKELITQIYKIDCPDSLRNKYWLRAYTLETKFYKDMNSDLMKNNSKIYLPYINLLYSCLANNYINFNISNDLYRGALIDKKEIENLIKIMKKKEVDIPCGTIFSKAFMSFSLDVNVALDFMRKKIPTEKTARALFILKAEPGLDYKNVTNVDLEGISYFEDEKEILLFPYSVYEINDIQKQENFYKIYLNYIGKYKKKVYFKKKSDLFFSFEFNSFMNLIEEASFLNHKNSFCRISLEKNGHSKWASGFCCLVPLPNKKIKIPVLITCNHVLSQDDIKNNKNFQIEYMNKHTSFNFIISKFNKIYCNDFYHITIIEIGKNSDIYQQMKFMDIDEDIFKDLIEMKNIFQNQEEMIPQYKDGTICMSFGCIKIENDFDINYNISTEAGSSGSPIISSKLKVIGYHIGAKKFKNVGGLLKLPIQKFISKYYS